MPTEHAFQIPTTPDAWCARLQREHPELAVEVLGIFPGSNGDMLETVRVVGRNVTKAVDTVRFTDGVRHFEILRQEPNACTLRIQALRCQACTAAQGAGIAPTFPLLVAGGNCHWRLETAPERAREFAEALEPTKQSPTLTRKRELAKPPLLTPRQREILAEAIAQGYYARPRRVSLTGLATQLNIHKSSLSQSLATIEAKLLPRWAEFLGIEEGSRP